LYICRVKKTTCGGWTGKPEPPAPFFEHPLSDGWSGRDSRSRPQKWPLVRMGGGKMASRPQMRPFLWTGTPEWVGEGVRKSAA